MDFHGIFEGRRVLVTGHTGFKGAWLSLWLKVLGAEVHGISLAPDTDPSMFAACGIAGSLNHQLQDIRDGAVLRKLVQSIRPEFVFHLAAQPLVRRSYLEPIETFETNTMGTAYLLEALRSVEGVRAVVCVTTDKVYDNKEWERPYGEGDLLGGKEPYSASKSAAEMVIGGYRGLLAVPLASARGGNVIGGGDWSEDRLVPDLVRAITTSTGLTLRNPEATRPWQHVLCLCHAYLTLAKALVDTPKEAAAAWNFGPNEADTVSVRSVLERFEKSWTLPRIGLKPEPGKPESQILKLNSAKAEAELNWHPAWALDCAVSKTADWYKAYADGADMRAVSEAQIKGYCRDLGKTVRA